MQDRSGRRAQYVDADETQSASAGKYSTPNGGLREVHEKYSVDLGHPEGQRREIMITHDILATQLRDYLQHRTKRVR